MRKDNKLTLTRLCCMMMFLLFFISSMCAELPSVVSGTLTITVASEGELSTNYSVDDIKASGATCLKVVGPLNSDDFTMMKNVQKTLDQAAAKGHVSKKAASRTKSRIAKANNAAK